MISSIKNVKDEASGRTLIAGNTIIDLDKELRKIAFRTCNGTKIIKLKEGKMGIASDIIKKRELNAERLKKEAPDVFGGFNELMKYYYKHGEVSRKYKELMAVTASVATRCIPCLANHANNAIAAGATRQEVMESAAIGIEFGGGPSYVVVRDNLLEFLDDLMASR